MAALQDKAFYSDYIRYGVCPGYGNAPEAMADMIAQPHCRAYLIPLDGEPCRDILVEVKGDSRYGLSGICVAPHWQGQGIGRAAMAFLDREFPSGSWQLVTPADKEENLRFYRRHGYEKTGELVDQGVPVALVERSAMALTPGRGCGK